MQWATVLLKKVWQLNFYPNNFFCSRHWIISHLVSRSRDYVSFLSLPPLENLGYGGGWDLWYISEHQTVLCPEKSRLFIGPWNWAPIEKSKNGLPFLSQFWVICIRRYSPFPGMRNIPQKIPLSREKNEKRGDSNFLQNFLLFRIFLCSFTKSSWSFWLLDLLGLSGKS